MKKLYHFCKNVIISVSWRLYRIWKFLAKRSKSKKRLCHYLVDINYSKSFFFFTCLQGRNPTSPLIILRLKVGIWLLVTVQDENWQIIKLLFLSLGLQYELFNFLVQDENCQIIKLLFLSLGLQYELFNFLVQGFIYVDHDADFFSAGPTVSRKILVTTLDLYHLYKMYTDYKFNLKIIC